MGLPGMVLSAIAAAAGAIMYWPSPIKVRFSSLDRRNHPHDRGGIWICCVRDHLRGVERSGTDATSFSRPTSG